MTAPHASIVTAAADLVFEMPGQTIENLASTIETSDSPAVARSKLPGTIPHPYYRQLAKKFVDAWEKSNAGSPEAVALAVRTAAHVDRHHHSDETVELVWTGPDADVVPFRRTEQAILQVLDSAEKRITLIAYAVYKIPHVQDAIVRAAKRGVRITVVIETPDKVEGEKAYDTLKALGDEVAECSTVYFWPKKNRNVAASGKVGILHAKCVLADGRWLFLSSANLTEYAFSINMEMGVLITGGKLPRQVEENFKRLASSGVLSPVC